MPPSIFRELDLERLDLQSSGLGLLDQELAVLQLAESEGCQVGDVDPRQVDLACVPFELLDLELVSVL